MGAQLRLLEVRSRLGFEEQLVRSKEFHSSTLRSNWWLPEGKVQMLLILSNTSEGRLTAEGTASGLRNLARLKGLALRAHETAVIEAIPSGRAGRINFTHDGAPGDLIMRAVILAPESGYSSVIDSADPAGAKTSELHGAGMRLGEGVSPVLSLANHGEEASAASISLTVNVGGAVREIGLADVSLRAGGIETLERSAFEAALEAAGLQGVELAGVQVRYSTAPGSVTGYAASVSADRDIAYRVPLLDEVSNVSGQVTTFYHWVISEDAESTTSEFYQNQCGNYHPQTNPNGIISGAQLKANTIHHESANSPNSHYYQYKTAQDNSANNLGLVAESQIGAPSKSLDQFIMEVQDTLNNKLAMITSATEVEPCNGEVNRDGSNNCTFNGFINFPAYQPCN